eukprot:4595525-Amphidinium_carterae.1
MESIVRAHFMPNSTNGSVESTSEVVLSSVGTTFQVPETLCAEAGFQAPKVRATSRHFSY